ncbi:MAG: hypothetical protein WBO77_04510 [Microgenomates group bacterium]
MTLSELSYYSRKSLPFIILSGAFFLIFFAIIMLLMRAPVEVAPTTTVLNTTFGPLPAPVFTHKLDYPVGGTYELDNIEGRPISATDSAQVFFIPPKSPRFSYLQNIYTMAKNAGFNTERTPHSLQDTTAVFDDGTQRLSIDITYFNFSYKYSYERSALTFINPQITDETTIKDRAIRYLQQLGKYPPELAAGTQHIVYMRYNTDLKEFEVVKDPQDANVVEVDFFGPDVLEGAGEYPIVSPKYFTSENYVVMSMSGLSPKILKAQIKFFEKDEANTGVYPLKTGDEAWAEFNTGNGTIVSPGGESYPIKIKKMFLGYFEPDTYQPYFQPVYVFLGDNNFAAYVPAVKN